MKKTKALLYTSLIIMLITSLSIVLSNSVMAASSGTATVQSGVLDKIKNKEFTIIIGKSSTVKDMEAALNAKNSFGIKGTILKYDDEIISANIQTGNYLIIGGPCTNRVSAALLGKPWPMTQISPAVDCNAVHKSGEAFLQAFTGTSATAAITHQIVISGYSATDTRRAMKFMTKYAETDFTNLIQNKKHKVCGSGISQQTCTGGTGNGGVICPDVNIQTGQCVQPCPSITNPACTDGKLIDQGKDQNGCALAPICQPCPATLSGCTLGTTDSDNDGCKDVNCPALKIAKVAWPEAVMQYQPTQFSVQASGGRQPYSYNWDFGDAKTSTEQAPKKAYKAAKTFSAKITVTDAARVSAAETKSLTIALAPPNTCVEDGTATKACSVETKGMYCDDISGELIFNCKCCSNGCNAAKNACN